MASAPIRDLLGDHLITPQKAVLALIDYQPSQIATSRSMESCSSGLPRIAGVAGELERELTRADPKEWLG